MSAPSSDGTTTSWARRRSAANAVLPTDPGNNTDRVLAAYEEILEAISEGVLLLDESLKPVLSNAAAEHLLGLEQGTIPLRLPSDELLTLAVEALEGRPGEQVLKLWFPAPRTVKVRAIALSGGGVMMTMLDVTEEFLAQRIRREFVTHASHELKSPVAGIQTLASAIRQAIEDDRATARRFSDRLVNEADRLGRLINDLLDLSRIEERSVPNAPVDVAEVALRMIDEMRVQARLKQVTLRSNIDPDATVRGDAQQLSLLLRNLLDNAIRYTPPQGTVNLDIQRTQTMVTVTVTDDGMGIPLEAQPRIFERFYRVDKARTRDRGGTGLGLAIVKHVAELHGGGVEVHSELGRGSSFIARLPVLADEDSGRESA